MPDKDRGCFFGFWSCTVKRACGRCSPRGAGNGTGLFNDLPVLSPSFRSRSFAPSNRVVPGERRTTVPRVHREATRNYNSRRPPRRGGVASPPRSRAGTSGSRGVPERPGARGGTRGGPREAARGLARRPGPGSRRHAASQGSDPGAKPGQHRRCPEHAVSAAGGRGGELGTGLGQARGQSGRGPRGAPRSARTLPPGRAPAGGGARALASFSPPELVPVAYRRPPGC